MKTIRISQRKRSQNSKMPITEKRQLGAEKIRTTWRLCTNHECWSFIGKLNYPILMAQQYYFIAMTSGCPGAATITVQQHPKPQIALSDQAGSRHAVLVRDARSQFGVACLHTRQAMRERQSHHLVDFSGVKVQLNYYFQVVIPSR